MTDEHQPPRRTYWIIWYAIVVHAVWGVTLFLDPVAVGATPLASLVAWAVPARSVTILAVTLMAASVLAARGMMVRDYTRATTLLWALPQQFLLLVTGIGAYAAAASGHYADGVPRPFAFIFADQFTTMMIAVFHTLALIEIGRAARWRH